MVTLGIIGVVAALTMPSLIQNQNKQIIETRLKEFYSTINQAILMAEQDKSIMRTDWKLVAQCDHAERNSYLCNLKVFNEYFKDYIKYTKLENINNNLYVYFTDGSVVKLAYLCQDFYFYPKASGIKKDVPGKDRFLFGFYPAGADGNRNKYFKNLGVEPYIHSSWDGTEEGLYLNCNNAAKIIQLNDWKIPDDYPCLKN